MLNDTQLDALIVSLKQDIVLAETRANNTERRIAILDANIRSATVLITALRAELTTSENTL